MFFLRTSAWSFILLLFFAFLRPVAAAPEPITGRVELRFLDDRHLALVCIYDDFLQQHVLEKHGGQLKKVSADPTCKEWSKQFYYTFAMAQSISEYRPAIAGCLQYYSAYRISGNQITEGGYWLNSTRLNRVPDLLTGKPRITANADVAHYVFLTLEKPLQKGQQYQLEMPTGKHLEWQYQGEETLSYLYKFNQLGFSPSAKRKYAYFGGWLGDAGTLDISRHLGKEFKILSSKHKKMLFKGPIKERNRETYYGAAKVKYTGEQVAELDFSEFNIPGEYYFQIEGIGRSRDFRISQDCIGEAFYLHSRGLYHKRCGISKEFPFTCWTCEKCHLQTLKGNFPPNDRHYRKSGENEQRSYGFFDQKGNSLDVRHFDLIRLNAPEPAEVVPGLYGGWHDAADHDRRSYHLRIVNDLLAAFLMFPDHFSDGQLNIPESGDGIPDLLNEVLWGMNMWFRAQQPDGGVGTWIESISHPVPEGYNPSTDPSPFYLSLATRNSSLEYAAHAAMLAIALRQIEQVETAEKFQSSASKAFAFALNSDNRIDRQYRYLDSKKQPVLIRYCDNPELSLEYYLKAGFNLFLLTGDHAYLNDVEDNPKKYLKVINDCKWNGSPGTFVELLLFGEKNIRLYKLVDTYFKTIMALADEHLQMLEENHSYRIAWYDGKHPYTGFMSWGNCHPLRRAFSFILAWKASGKTIYRDAAHLANDWHNGGNPLGISMTSGLGHTYPVCFLDLLSYVDGISEAVPGITPYRHTFGIASEDSKIVHGLFKSPRLDHRYMGCSESLLPKKLSQGQALNEAQTREKLGNFWPIWRRYINLEGLSVAASEYTVYETIAPAAAITGCLLEPGWMPSEELKSRRPAENCELLPGFAPLP